ncbi:MAG: calcium-binding protein, partial [Halomonadaceae bacterium]
SRGISELATGDGGSVTNGRIGPAETGELRWLIIPTAGAGGDTEDGKLYFVGAKLELRYGNERETLVATPDSIRVRPQPTLVLDYFLPREVHGNNPMTPTVEPVEPYTLGVRIANTGSGAANNLKIDSAQPEIVENEQGLLVDFTLTGSYVDDETAQRTLLLNFGTIPSGHNRMGRWIMESSLSGRFTAFNARMSHADELGGALTSLIDNIYTHTLVADVLVDLPDRDRVRDYLARVGTELRVFESERTGQDTMDCIDCAPVAELSGSLSAGQNTSNGIRHTLSVSASEDFVHIKLPDPYQGERPLTRATRGDGTLLHGANMWQSKSLRDNNVSYDYFVHLFDARPATQYQLLFNTEALENQPPQIAYIADYTTVEGEQVGFLVIASDPDGTIPSLSAKALPSGATFSDRGNGQGVFSWFPDPGQAGEYEVTFEATDGALTAARSTTITVHPEDDPDGTGGDDEDGPGDGTPGDGGGDGSGDDGEGGGPSANAPAAVQIINPILDDRVRYESPVVELRSTDYDASKTVTYTIELYTDAAMTQRFARLENILETGEYTQFVLTHHLSEPLEKGQVYFWRVKANTHLGRTEWVYSRFTYYQQLDFDQHMNIHSPRVDMAVDTLRPTLATDNADYVAGADVTYLFAVISEDDPEYAEGRIVAEGLPAGSDGVTRWTFQSDLQDGAVYLWAAIATDEWDNFTNSKTGSFTVDLSNQAPSKPTIVTPAVGALLTSTSPSLVAQGSTDPEGASVTYHFQLLNMKGQLLQEAAVASENSEATWELADLADNRRYRWRVRASDGHTDSEVAEGYFDIVTGNQPPHQPTRGNPADKAWIQVLSPTLWVQAVDYPASVNVSYEFELYRDAYGTDLVDASSRNEPFWPLSFELANHRDYYWRVRATVDGGAQSPWSELDHFFVNQGGGSLPPTLDFVLPDQNITLEGGEVL